MQAPSCVWRLMLPRRLRPQERRRVWCQQCAGSSLRTRMSPTRTASCLQMSPQGWATHTILKRYASAESFSAAISLIAFSSLSQSLPAAAVHALDLTAVTAGQEAKMVV